MVRFQQTLKPGSYDGKSEIFGVRIGIWKHFENETIPLDIMKQKFWEILS